MLSAIYCCDRNGVIGYRDTKTCKFFQSIDCPADKKYFAQTTKGKTVIMGGNTARGLIEEIGGLLPGRAHIVLTRDPALTAQLKQIAEYQSIPCTVITEIQGIQNLDGYPEECFVIGGADLIAQLRDVISTYYVTEFDVADEFPDHFEPIKVEVIGSCKDGTVKPGFTRVECKKFTDFAGDRVIQGYFGKYIA